MQMKRNLWAPVMLPMLPSVTQFLDTLLASISGLAHRAQMLEDYEHLSASP